MSQMLQITNLQAFISQSSIQSISEFFFHIINFKNDSNYLLNLEKYKNFNITELIEESNILLNELNNLQLNSNSNMATEKETFLIDRLNLDSIQNFPKKDFSNFLFDLIYKKSTSSNSNNLIAYDWQLSIIERENEKLSVNSNKIDKVEMAMKFEIFNSKEDEYQNKVLKMGYNEFSEIFQNLKKINGQLQLFKN